MFGHCIDAVGSFANKSMHQSHNGERERERESECVCVYLVTEDLQVPECGGAEHQALGLSGEAAKGATRGRGPTHYWTDHRRAGSRTVAFEVHPAYRRMYMYVSSFSYMCLSVCF